MTLHHRPATFGACRRDGRRARARRASSSPRSARPGDLLLRLRLAARRRVQKGERDRHRRHAVDRPAARRCSRRTSRSGAVTPRRAGRAAARPARARRARPPTCAASTSSRCSRSRARERPRPGAPVISTPRRHRRGSCVLGLLGGVLSDRRGLAGHGLRRAAPTSRRSSWPRSGCCAGRSPGAGFGFGVGLFVDIALLQTLGADLARLSSSATAPGGCASCATRAHGLVAVARRRGGDRVAAVGFALLQFLLGVDAP